MSVSPASKGGWVHIVSKSFFYSNMDEFEQTTQGDLKSPAQMMKHQPTISWFPTSHLSVKHLKNDLWCSPFLIKYHPEEISVGLKKRL